MGREFCPAGQGGGRGRKPECQRIYLGVNRRKKKDKQRRAELGIKQEESEEATLPREAQGQQEALAENKGE